MQIVNHVGCRRVAYKELNYPKKRTVLWNVAKAKFKKKLITVIQKDNRTWLSSPHPSFHDYPSTDNLFHCPDFIN